MKPTRRFWEPAGDHALAELMVSGAAAIEQGRGDEAVKAFEKCKAIKPDSPATWVNLALAYLEVDEYRKAITVLAQAERLDPDLPSIPYSLGLCQKHLGQLHLALANFRRVLAMDSECAEANYNVGLILRDLNQWGLARKHFQEAARLNPNHLYSHYHLMRLALLRADNAEALKQFKAFSSLRSRSTRTALDAHVAERGKYSVPLPPGSLGGWDAIELPASFAFREVDLAEMVPDQDDAPVAIAATWCETNGDEYPDIALGIGSSLKFILNKKGLNFSAQPERVGKGPEGQRQRLGVGDFNNDNRLDVFSASSKALAVSLNRKDEEAKVLQLPIALPENSTLVDAASIDYDHDGDLDLIVLAKGGTSKAFVIQNRGDDDYRKLTGTFASKGTPSSIAAGDMDNDDDIDFVFANSDGPLLVYENLGAGRFKLDELATDLKTPPATDIQLADLNNDLRLDIVLISTAGELSVHLSKGSQSFESGDELNSSKRGAARAQCIADFDNDGFLDLCVCYGPENENGTLEMFRGSPEGFQRLERTVFPNEGDGFNTTQLLPEDADLDGDLDILMVEKSGNLRLLLNEVAAGNHWMRIRATGLRSNAAGIGTRLDVRDGWRRLRRQSAGMPVHIGLGKRDKVQVLRVLWPSGLVQNQLDLQANVSVEIREDARIPASCPFLFARGEKGYEFLTDFLGGGATGEYSPPGEPYIPDTDDVLTIRADRLKPLDGSYSLRITFELQEVIYLDSVSLSAIRHPEGVTVISDEALYQPPRKDITLHALKNIRPAAPAWNSKGDSCGELLRLSDHKAVHDFEIERQPGLTAPHSLTIDLGKDTDPTKSVLVLRGWTQWPNSSSVLGRSQSTAKTISWPELQMKDQSGQWRTVPIQTGVPAGKLRPVMYDLRNQWLSDDRQVRLITSMAIFWDQAQVGEMVDEEIEIQKLELQQARLRWRGYSTPFMNPEGTLELYHYLPSLGYWPWQRHRGHYSQHGRADTLVSKPDGRLLVAAHGDELQMDFKSAGAPDTVRQFVFHAVGLGKDYDPNTQAHTTVGPIPAQQFGSRDEDGIPISTEQERCRYFEISLPRTTR